MNPVPTREDVALDQILRACGRPHDFPEFAFEPTETRADASGGTVNIRRVACRTCGTVSVSQWPGPLPEGPGQVVVVSRYERPEPGDVPGLADRARQVTDAELAEYLAGHGFPDGVPEEVAPDRRATARTERLGFVLRVRTGQFALLDRGRRLGDILPIPASAESADLIDAVPGAALFWSPVHDGDLPLTVTLSPGDPGPDRSYRRIAELSCRFQSGHAVLREVAGRELELPPLPAGHGDYRIRFHTADSGCLLQLWSQPRTKPRIHG
ncbi:hypothetical protein ACFXPA_11620 [Amycolatopsis sp. NPDC059090]|uniref:hypothetical protein n=1 Tax=unclassified Amycolatopsis TaxID=2618356 RepID=UPI003670DB4E